jgi:3-oxoacyl-[acyl-carrier protein] reductase
VMKDSLNGKVALITGAGRGIGRALAIRLAAEGAAVVVNDLDSETAAATIAAIAAAGGRAFACTGNVTAPDFGERFVQTALDTFGGIDIIVSNAGYARDAVVQNMTDDQFQDMLDVHLIAPFRILRAAAEPIRLRAKQDAREGREVIRKVVLISSMAGTNGNAGQINYSSSKAGLIGMTKTMAKEWGRYKVCVNCVAFGLIDTRLSMPANDPQAKFAIENTAVHAGIPANLRDETMRTIPLGRAGTTEEAAGAVSFFCGPDSDYVSGQVLVVGGGL